jgi:hypothetical protein
MNSDNGQPERGPNCWQCRFFAVSWDPRLPYACQRMGFKSAALPALEVLRTDGQRCRGFEAKASAPTPSSGAASATSPDSQRAPVRLHSTRGWTA